jgi:hypothetical protein
MWSTRTLVFKLCRGALKRRPHKIAMAKMEGFPAGGVVYIKAWADLEGINGVGPTTVTATVD